MAAVFLNGCASLKSSDTGQQLAEIGNDINNNVSEWFQQFETQPSEQEETATNDQQTDQANSENESSLAATEIDQHPRSPYDFANQDLEGPDYHANLWDRIRTNLRMPRDLDQPRVKAQLNWYKKHPKYFKRISDRASLYMYHIVNEIEKRDLPSELALLPIVESAYDPFAYSHGRASGLWQFIPSTGRHFKLKQDWWYDGRRDITASTDAALTYLERLNKRFDGDWLLALAAYNAGGGNISKAIRKNKKKGKPTDFFSLKLPRETQAYSPKMIALAELLANPEKYDFEWPTVPNKPYFEAIDVHSQIDLAQAADLAEMEINDLYKLNPGFNQWATHPKGPHKILVPLEQSELFKENLAGLDPKQRVSWERYKIRSGDSLITIAKRYRTTPEVLKEVNNIRKNMIRAGDTLLIPTTSRDMDEYTLSAIQRLHKRQSRAPSKNRHKMNYQVQGGDSFWTISRKFKVGVRELARWNHMAPTDPLKINQNLVIWTKSPQTVKNNQKVIRKVGYKVRKGDSLARIATKFRVSVGDIRRWNPRANSKYIQPGQSLTLYVDVTKAH
jgi:membrane-bound lytic murein transglycosylase D